MKIAVTITFLIQTSPEDWKNISKTKVFTLNASLWEIFTWARSEEKSIAFHQLQFTEVVE